VFPVAVGERHSVGVAQETREKHEVAFAVAPRDDLRGVVAVVPTIDGIALTDRIHRFELEAGMEDRAVSYGGLVPAYYRFGPMDQHYLAGDGSIRDEGKVPLLGCNCGEWGCWPLMARIAVSGDEVRWDDFAQPYRRERNYDAFGPFVFSRVQYGEALRRLMRDLAEASGT
jgi:hypothetical protein